MYSLRTRLWATGVVRQSGPSRIQIGISHTSGKAVPIVWLARGSLQGRGSEAAIGTQGGGRMGAQGQYMLARNSPHTSIAGVALTLSKYELCALDSSAPYHQTLLCLGPNRGWYEV